MDWPCAVSEVRGIGAAEAMVRNAGADDREDGVGVKIWMYLIEVVG
jgi:hypothetical protein